MPWRKGQRRPLTPAEAIHYKNRNPLNHELGNLEVMRMRDNASGAKSNLDRFEEVLGVRPSSYYAIAHQIGTTIEDCMCAKGEWLETLLRRAERLNQYEREELKTP